MAAIHLFAARSAPAFQGCVVGFIHVFHNITNGKYQQLRGNFVIFMYTKNLDPQEFVIKIW